MRILIVYYSRTNRTKTVATEIQKNLNGEIEEIKEINNHNGIIGYIKGGYESIRRKEPKIKPSEINPSDYDLTIIGTPVWAGTIASPVLTYLKENKNKFNNVSFFCTCGSSGYESSFKEMEETTGKKPVSTFYLRKEDFDKDYQSKINNYIEELKTNL